MEIQVLIYRYVVNFNIEFIDNAKTKNKHYDKYDYSLVMYKNAKSKIKIICKEHGISMKPETH